MKREIIVYGYNKRHGKFVIHTSDQYNKNTTVQEGEVSIHFNKIGEFNFKIYPSNRSFKMLIPIETDIVVCEKEDDIERQIFTGIVMNIKAFSNKSLDIGKEVVCVSSHVFFSYRPISNFTFNAETNEYEYKISTKSKNIDIIKYAIELCLKGCKEENDINRYKYIEEKNILNWSEQANFSAIYTIEDDLKKMFSDIMSFYDLILLFQYNFDTTGIDRHEFYFKQKKEDLKPTTTLVYGELLSDYEDEVDFKTYANDIVLFGKTENSSKKINSRYYNKFEVTKCGTFRLNRTSEINAQETLGRECNRQLTLAKEPQHSFSIDFIDKDNTVRPGETIEVQNKALGEEKIIFLVQKMTFNLDRPYHKKVELRHKKYSYIEALGKGGK